MSEKEDTYPQLILHNDGKYEIKISENENIKIPVKSISIGGLPIGLFVEDIQDTEGLESNENYKSLFKITKGRKNKENSLNFNK